MKCDYTLFIDSGMGGISILDYFLKIKDDVNIIYFADTKNFPYGNKSEDYIGNVLYNSYMRLNSQYNIELIVIVCNTASVSALTYLRNKISIPIIGTVPAIKPAAVITKNNNIGIIATETTVNGDYLGKLVNKHADNKNVLIKSASGMVKAVENHYDENKLSSILNKELKFFIDYNIDTLVLGCTHYSFISEEILKYFQYKVQIVDSREGVSKRILQLLPDKGVSDSNKRILYLSKGTGEIKKKYNKLNEKLKIFEQIIIEDISCLKV